jgi:chitin synthase
LSIDYPVPSAIKNAVQAKYRDVEGGFGDFHNMRCEMLNC